MNISNPKNDFVWIFYIYDFSVNEWINATIENILPFNLYEFSLANGKKVVSCINSYRISETLNNTPSNSQMNQLRVAHEQLLTDKIIYSKLSNNYPYKNLFFKENDMYCTCNIHIEEGIIFAFNQYHYYEDNFFIVNVPENIKVKNLIYFRKIQKQLHQKDILRDEIVSLLPFYLHNKTFIKDIRPYWKTLNYLKETVTFDVIVKSGKTIRFNEQSFYQHCQQNKITKSTIGLVFYNDKYSWVFTCEKENITNGYYDLTEFDGYFDINIYGGTYAYLQYDTYLLNLDKVDDYFTFIDITNENPLFNSIYGDPLRIYTDGKTVSYNGLLLDTFPRYVLKSIHNKYSISFFPSHKKILLLGHTWVKSEIIELTD